MQNDTSPRRRGGPQPLLGVARCFVATEDPARTSPWLCRFFPIRAGRLHMGHVHQLDTKPTTIGVRCSLDSSAHDREQRSFQPIVGMRSACRRKTRRWRTVRASDARISRTEEPAQIAVSPWMEPRLTTCDPNYSTAGISGFSCACWNGPIAIRKTAS